jgi:hypothetical protein
MRLALLLLLSCLHILSAPSLLAAPPDLVVVISIDQFPTDYITRFEPFFVEGGLKRLMSEGAYFANSRYEHAVTYTGPGHAVIGTGLHPAESAIVANDWWDRAVTDKEYCVDDDRVKISAGPSGPMSPVNRNGDSLGDRLRERYPESKIIGVSLKDRASILMAGRKANAAYWFEDDFPGFLSSSYYRYNDKVLAFNERLPAFLAQHREWRELGVLRDIDIRRLTFDPPSLFQHKRNEHGLGVTFPHPIAHYPALIDTPYGNDLLVEFAKHVIEVENLGAADGGPDVLFVSFTSTDYFGHYYGPESREAADGVLRIDRSLAGFMEWLDARYRGRLTIALSSDHGIQSIPEVARAMGRPGGRVDMTDPSLKATRIGEIPKTRRQLEYRLARRMGVQMTDDSPITWAIVPEFEEPGVWLNWSRLRELKIDSETAKKIVIEELLRIEGVEAAYTNTELVTPNSHPTPIELALRKSFNAERSPDILFTLKEGYIWFWRRAEGTTHGQPVERDQRVPLIFWGNGIKRGRYTGSASPTDIASTIGAILGVKAGREGATPLPCLTAP